MFVPYVSQPREQIKSSISSVPLALKSPFRMDCNRQCHDGGQKGSIRRTCAVAADVDDKINGLSFQKCEVLTERYGGQLETCTEQLATRSRQVNLIALYGVTRLPTVVTLEPLKRRLNFVFAIASRYVQRTTLAFESGCINTSPALTLGPVSPKTAVFSGNVLSDKRRDAARRRPPHELEGA